ncbi:MAG: methyltransferase domain-containing protein [bacterium]|nr:methyltransferase domain-containing protein [bacterium]
MNARDHYKETKRVYNAIAVEKRGFYDADFTGKLQHSRFQLSVRKTVGKIFDALQTPRNLEVGCGNGDFLLELAGKYPNAYFQGLDFSEEQIKLAQEDSQHGDNIRFESGNALQLDLEDNSFDTVVFMNVLHHIPSEDQRIVLGELSRVAKTHIILEIKHAENFYYKYIRTGFGAHNAYFHSILSGLGEHAIPVYPTTPCAVTMILQNYDFELLDVKPLWGFSFLSPLVVLHFKHNASSI